VGLHQPLDALRRGADADARRVYAITAYILYSNDLVDDDFVLSHENFAEFEMYNADGFIVDDRDAGGIRISGAPNLAWKTARTASRSPCAPPCST
jgi:hypothetical protein